MEPLNDRRNALDLLNRSLGTLPPKEVVHRGRFPRWLLVALVVGVLLGVILGLAATLGMLESEEVEPPYSDTISTSAVASVEPSGVTATDTEIQITAAGFIKAAQLATVSAEVTGTLKATFVKRGDHVKKGDPIAELDTKSLRNQLLFANAQLRIALSNERQAKERLPLEEERFRRIAQLHQQLVVPPQEYENAQSELIERRAEVNRYNLQAESAAIEVKGRTIELERSTIRAPFDGVIVSLDAAVGEVVSPISAAGSFARTGIATLVDTQSFYAEIWVPEKSLPKLKAQQRVQVKPDAFPDISMSGNVSYISPVVDEQRAAVLVRIALGQSTAELKHDMSVHVDLL